MPDKLPQITFEFVETEARAQEKEVNTFLSKKAPTERDKKTRGRKSLKDMDLEVENIEIPPDEILFQKQYYSIGEVAGMFKVNNSLLRYWENEFDVLEPRKNRKGDRFFKPSDIKNLQLIHDLLRRRKFTIEGAKEYMKKAKHVNKKHEMIQSLQKLRSFLMELKASL